MPIACGATLGALLAPSLCWSCGGLARLGQPLCRSCRGRLHRLAPDPVWLSFVRVWAPVAYSGPARDLVRALKFRGAIGVADAMAAQIAANAPPGWLDDRTLVPVPLHPSRLRSRGCNQAAAIAAALASRAGLEAVDCLARTGSALTQVGRRRAERRAGPAGTIEVRGGGAAREPAAGAQSAPKRLLLVDDVVTTGATLAACRAALVAGGALEVDAVVFARTLGR
jgi:predicted amidophosphoribosyltransferase